MLEMGDERKIILKIISSDQRNMFLFLAASATLAGRKGGGFRLFTERLQQRTYYFNHNRLPRLLSEVILQVFILSLANVIGVSSKVD